MKWLALVVLLVTGLVHADDAPEKRGVLRRATRQAVNSMSGSFLKNSEKNIINNCKKNGLSSNAAYQLKETFDNMKRCMSGVIMFIDTKRKYLDKMDECTSDPIKQVKDCLQDDQKYFPKLLLDLAKSIVNFLYDDKSLLQNYEISSCMANLGKRNVAVEYVKCLQDSAKDTLDDENIPPSKAEFCKKFMPAVECFPYTLKNHCTDNRNVNQFFKDYVRAMEAPCDSENIL